MDWKRNESTKAVFLDRDGVLCEDTDYVTSFEKLHIFPFAREAIDLIHEKGYLAIVVTNQSAVARGMMSENKLRELNCYLQKRIGVDAIYYCPHLPPNGKIVLPYQIHCECRKPNIGMLKQAAFDYGIDMQVSYMVGDRESDIQAGKNAGVTPILISNVKKDIETYRTIYEFAESL